MHIFCPVRAWLLVGVAAVCSGTPLAALAQDESSEPYFLREQTYGSEALFSPYTVLLNSGFDIFRSGSYKKSLLDQACSDKKSLLEPTMLSDVMLNSNVNHPFFSRHALHGRRPY